MRHSRQLRHKTDEWNYNEHLSMAVNAAEELDGTIRAKASPNKKLHAQAHEVIVADVLAWIRKAKGGGGATT